MNAVQIMQGYGERFSSPCRQQYIDIKTDNSCAFDLAYSQEVIRALKTLFCFYLNMRNDARGERRGSKRVLEFALRFLIISEVSLTGDTHTKPKNCPASLMLAGFEGF